ncbi:hypothetical protein G7077_10220 [Sphingomonas piscis]|uniref:Ig-like domain-containing protein n=1 Tax=Sphingomonas piscis TaxID=2714943 RepID=A0A6G7YLB3_9SPHN|nr:hypothetical protein [Sphingomonas piscis]QIK77534.1 hypothetical protein G7077_10220 [Sphingomonas piscis]
MTRTLVTLTLVAAAALAGCSKDDSSNENAANEVMNEPVVLPPSITASKTYRCKDNSLVYIDWLSDGTAKIKKNKEDYSAPVVTPGADGAPLKGAAADATVTVNGQSCKA